jgi:hypothetical protein
MGLQERCSVQEYVCPTGIQAPTKPLFREGEGSSEYRVAGDAGCSHKFKHRKPYCPRPSLQRLEQNVCKQSATPVLEVGNLG